jgi:CRP-like cAMP-binding protein
VRVRSHQVGSLERLHWLKASSPFRDLPPADLAVLAQHAGERLVPRGRPLLKAGEPVSAIHFVVEGRVRVRRGPQTTHALPGESLGILELCAEDEEGVDAIADTETLSLTLTADAFLDLLEDYFPIFHTLLRRVCALRVDQGGDVPAEAHAADVSRASTVPRARELDLVERIVFLRRTFPFARGRLSALAELAQHVTEIRHAPGATIWSAGDASDHLLLVVSGGVACVPTGEAAPFRYGPEGATGTLEAVAGVPRWFDATAEATGLQALSLDVEHLLDIFEDNFEMARDYLRWVSRHALDEVRRGTAGAHAHAGLTPAASGDVLGAIDARVAGP